MFTYSPLQAQVRGEIKKRKLIFFTIVLIGIAYFLVSFIFGDSGLIKYIEISKKKSKMEKEIVSIQNENEQLKRDIKAIKEEPFYTEKYAREEYGLVRPGEIVIIDDNRQ